MSDKVESDLADSLRGDEDDDEVDEFDGDDTGAEESDTQQDDVDQFADPLSLLDPNANLDAVLNARSIGEAIQILSPNLPGKTKIKYLFLCTIFINATYELGLPSKARGKYRKRKYLSDEKKGEIMRDQNRDNARRTRKRKKLYDYFLSRVLEELGKILERRGGLSKISAVQSIDVEASRRIAGEDQENCARRIEIDARIERLQKFIVMRVSSTPDKEAWSSVCSGLISQRMSVPKYREMSGAGVITENMYECRGIPAVIEDAYCRIKFFASVM